MISLSFLAHLSRRLIGELIVSVGLRRLSSMIRRRPSLSTRFKQILFGKQWASQCQNSYEESIGLVMGKRKVLKMVLVT